MPFGLRNAQRTFQRLMDEFTIGLDDHVQTYMYDVIVFSSGSQEHEQHLRNVLTRLETNKLKVNLEKIEFFLLGHILSEAGTTPDPDKVKAIRQMPIPETKKALKSYLGMVNYYRRFVPGLSGRVEPLIKLLKVTHVSVWGQKL